jgi:hypothetical protein
MRSLVITTIVLMMLAACNPETNADRYHQLLKKELASGKKVDSIFFGIYLGMPEQEFYRHCWDMNTKGVFTDGNDGSGNMCVLYKLTTGLKYPASMDFFPDFKDSSISKMRTSFQYVGWAPWNKHLNADHLLPDVLSMYQAWYKEGNPFIELEGKNGTRYVKVDGNRQITLQKSDDVLVEANYEDLLAEPENNAQHGR